VIADAAGTPRSPFGRIEQLKVPTVEMEALPRLLPRGVKRFGGLNAHRLLSFEVHMGWRQTVDRSPDPRAIAVEGGWSALAEQVGAGGSKKAADELHQLVAAQAHLLWKLPDGSVGNMLSYELRPARPGQRARVTLVLGSILLPGYVHALKGQHPDQREARKLVPMLTQLPPVIGPGLLHGAQASLHLKVLMQLRRRARELWTLGGVLLEREQFRELAAPIGLKDWASRLLDRWTRDGRDGPAFLRRVDGHRYTLGDAHQPARDYLLQAGRDEFRGEEAGRKGAELRRRAASRR
jgi:hypothetical protein